jgi:peptide deformylase
LAEINPAKLRIITYPDPRLRKPCQPVTQFDETLAAVARRMIELMRGAKGVGLAAPQVGLSWQLFVCNVTGQEGDDLVCLNPRLTDLAGLVENEEGCLCLPDVTVTVRRNVEGVLHAQDLGGKRFQRRGAGLQARCWQHECDHLNGRLIIDYMSEADKIANRRVLRQLEAKAKTVSPARK